jgi:cytochrome c
MRTIKAVTAMAVLMLCFAAAFASGSAEEGRKLFNDPAFAGSTNSMSCNTCHRGGMRLEKAGTRKYTTFMGTGITTLEEVVNVCITNPLKGKALAVDSKEMKDMVAYIKSLGK